MLQMNIFKLFRVLVLVTIFWPLQAETKTVKLVFVGTDCMRFARHADTILNA